MYTQVKCGSSYSSANYVEDCLIMESLSHWKRPDFSTSSRDNTGNSDRQELKALENRTRRLRQACSSSRRSISVRCKAEPFQG